MKRTAFSAAAPDEAEDLDELEVESEPVAATSARPSPAAKPQRQHPASAWWTCPNFAPAGRCAARLSLDGATRSLGDECAIFRLEVTVELGRTRLLIRDILDLSAGSIIELDKIAG